LSNNKTHANKAIDAPSSTSVQGLDEKEYKNEHLKVKQRKVMKDKWLKADEMGNIYTDLIALMIIFN